MPSGIVQVSTLPVMELIEHQVKADSLDTDFTTATIPDTFRHLYLTGFTRTTSSYASIDCQFNADTGANYQKCYWWYSNAAIAGGGVAAASDINIGSSSGTWDTTRYSTFATYIMNYAGDQHKGVTSKFGRSDSNALLNTSFAAGGVWEDTSAITVIKLTISAYAFQVGSEIALYGIR